MAAREIEYLVTYQIGALQALSASHGARVDYVKPHGALNNIAHDNREVADAIAKGIRAAGRDLVFVANCLSEMTRAAVRAGLPVAHEAYADRQYSPDGRLMPRSISSSVIGDPEISAKRALVMAQEQCLMASDGSRLPTRIDTFCVHADEPSAAAIAKGVRSALETAGITVTPVTGNRA